MKNLRSLSIIFLLSQVASSPAKPVDFAREVLPILSDKCFICHGPDSRKKDQLRLDSFEGATSDLGGYKAIDPADLKKSELIARIHDAEDPMPPEKAEKKLSPKEKEILKQWIQEGGTYAKHWAFVPPKKTSSKNNIDAFIEEKHKEKGIGFSPEADPATLARRAALILTGLPPEPGQLDAFLADKSPQAYEKLVDQLMAHPRYGEHQARYWLDAVRYGDTHGLHLDNKRGIYPYRDWVIQAFNENMPFDDFITWQLAGDLLPNPTLAQKVATGFVRMNPSTAEGGAIPDEFQAKNNFDRTENLGTVLLGSSLICARCHTHKYDPIPQTEYYRLLAFFNSTAEGPMDGNKYIYGPVEKAPPNLAAWQAWNDLEKSADALIAEADKKRSDTLTDPDLLAKSKKWETANQADRLKMLADPNGPLASLNLGVKAKEITDKRNKATAKFTTTLVAKELGKPRETKVLERGEYNIKIGDPLQPGIISVMGPFPKDAPRNRLGLAQWLTAPEHPLTSRVLINRVWQRTFGEGLVRTPADFGLQGEQPTHPELLDWLALEFQNHHWDLKHMLRLMVTSKTFRQKSAWRKDLDDPENRLFARGPSHRLDAEVLRDLALWSSGLLVPAMGGEGIKPYQPSGMWKALMHPGSNTKNYVRDKGSKLYHRSLYVYWKRTSPHPMMTLFDAPNRESSCVKRSRSNTSLQSLGLLNETQRIEMSRKLAERLIQSGNDDKVRLEQLYKMLASRAPSETEQKACNTLLKTMKDRYKDAEQEAVALLSTGEAPRDTKLNPVEHAAWTQVATTVLASDAAILLY